MSKKNKATSKNPLFMPLLIVGALAVSTFLVLGQAQNRQDYTGRAQVPYPNCLGSCPTQVPVKSDDISCVNDVCITTAPGQPNIIDCQNGICRDGNGNIIGGGGTQPGQPAQPAQPGIDPGANPPATDPAAVNPPAVNPPAGGQPPQNISIICQNGICRDGNGNPVSNPGGAMPGQPIQTPTMPGGGGFDFVAFISQLFSQLFNFQQP